MQHATPLVVWLQTLHHAQAPTPIPIARGPTGRPSLNTHRIGTGRRRGEGDQPKPHPDTDIANEPVGLVGIVHPHRCNLNRFSSAPRGDQPFGRRGREGLGSRSAISRSGRSTGRFQGWGPPPYHRVLRYEGGGTGGPAPISGNQPGLVEYATRRSPGLKGQQTQVTLSPQGTSTCRSMWR